MRSNAQQWRNAMRYWKCIRYPISREFTASGYAAVYFIEKPREAAVRNFISAKLRFDLPSAVDAVPDAIGVLFVYDLLLPTRFHYL